MVPPFSRRRVGEQQAAFLAVERIAVASQWQAYLAPAEDARLADAGAQMQGLVKHFAGSVNCGSVVENGRAAESIASIADQRRATVIVMGLGIGSALS